MKTNARKSILFFSLLSLLFTGCSSQKIIVNSVDEREANEITVFLQNKGIDAFKTPTADGGGGGRQTEILFDIKVPDSQATEATALLNIAGLPRRRGQTLLSIFAGGGLVPSQMEEKIRFQQGLAEQISTTIRKIDGVLDADVLLSFPEEDPLNPSKEKESVSASVYVKHSGVLEDPNANLSSKIRRLVASSIPGLEFDNVTVIGDRARFTNLSPEAAGGRKQDPLISVWTVLVAESSIGRFQTIFFSLLVLLLVASILLVWFVWKCFPLIKQAGGVKELVRFKPLSLEETAKTPSADETIEEDQETGDSDQEKKEEEEETMGT